MLVAANGMHGVAGCRQYFVYRGDEESIWISELWDSKAAHDASLDIPGTREFIADTRPLIASFEFFPVTPLGGVGPVGEE
jgi:quinol monooxygenase YgiN